VAQELAGIRVSYESVKRYCFLRLLLLFLNVVVFCGCCHQQVVASDKLIHLQLNECRTAVVRARAYWAGSGVLTEKGETFSFQVVSTDRWFDWYYPTCSRGYSSFPFQTRFERERRVPSAAWFALCGAVGPGGTPFQINMQQGNKMTSKGEIGLFANDLPCAYWNNLGSLRVRIARVQ
jgi:hypothetical protein